MESLSSLRCLVNDRRIRKEFEGCCSVTCMSIKPQVSREDPCQSFLGGDSCCGEAAGFSAELLSMRL